MNENTPEQLDNEDDKIRIVQYLSGMRNREPFWAYLAINPEAYALYYAKVGAQEPIELEDFGIIIHEGTGEEPPAYIKEQMEHDYNVSEETWDLIGQFGQELMELHNEENNGHAN